MTTAKDGRDGDSVADSPDQLTGDSGSSCCLVYLAAFVIKAIGFHFKLLVKVVTFRFRVSYSSYVLLVDPFGLKRRIRGYRIRKLVSLCKLVGGIIGSFVSDWIQNHKTTWKFMLWAIYVGIILCLLLVLSILVSGFLMRFLVETPLQMSDVLNFDCTKNSPVAYVLIIRSCDSIGCVNSDLKVGGSGSSGPKGLFIPPNHEVQVSVSLTLPESEYNRNLGMF